MRGEEGGGGEFGEGEGGEGEGLGIAVERHWSDWWGGKEESGVVIDVEAYSMLGLIPNGAGTIVLRCFLFSGVC